MGADNVGKRELNLDALRDNSSGAPLRLFCDHAPQSLHVGEFQHLNLELNHDNAACAVGAAPRASTVVGAAASAGGTLVRSIGELLLQGRSEGGAGRAVR